MAERPLDHVFFRVLVATEPIQRRKLSPANISLRTKKDVHDALKNLGVFDSKFSFFPVNDHSDRTTLGGTHWALLVRVKGGERERDVMDDGGWCFCGSAPQRVQGDAQWLYFDSDRQRNYDAAVRIATKIERANLSNSPVDIVAVPCAQQHNSSDCGMYVLLFAEHFAKERKVPDGVSEKSITELRRDLQRLIISLKT
eukprot:GEMP01103266.1.p1 GENE.GEMP01103266.1~~GEMP01103266.1.p1  ORF type:complete len:198 (+),score=32.52 GEMP01103266.1:175-768(+)